MEDLSFLFPTTLKALILGILQPRERKIALSFFMIICGQCRELCVGIYCWYRKKQRWAVVVGYPFRPPMTLAIELKMHRRPYKVTPSVLHWNAKIDNAKTKKEYLFGVNWWCCINLHWWEICSENSAELTLPSPLDKHCIDFAENLFPTVCILSQLCSTWRVMGLELFSLFFSKLRDPVHGVNVS